MKLYWRFKKDGKWTWAAATVTHVEEFLTVVRNWEEEE